MSVDIARERDMSNKRETKRDKDRDKDRDKGIDTQSVEREGGILYIYIYLGLSNNMVLRERRREEGRDERADGEV